MQERKKVLNHNLDKYSHLDTERRNSPSHVSIHQEKLSKKSDLDNISRESSLKKNRLGSFKLSQHTEGKKVSA